MTLYNINSNFRGHQELITFYEQNKNKMFEHLNVELKHFFAANMCAALGALLDLFVDDLNVVLFSSISPSVKQVLLKNDFLSYYGYNQQRLPDTNHTTIKYQKLNPTDGKYFKIYVIEELIKRTELPYMSESVKEKIVEAIYEIFVNAQIHSKTKSIYTCGQFYPQKNIIEFAIADTGIGFKNNINKRFNSNLNAMQAIKWAIEDKQTTKQGISGGIGLALLKEFVIKNGGKMQIISDGGYYELSVRGEISKPFSGKFPGTVVNLQFRTDDNNSYSLKEEIDINSIF